MFHWKHPSGLYWIEFVAVVILLFICMFSMASLLVSTVKSKQERIIAVNRLEAIYQDLMRSDRELKELKIKGNIEEKTFHSDLNRSIKVRDEILEKISVKIGIPQSEIKEILKKDPVYHQ